MSTTLLAGGPWLLLEVAVKGSLLVAVALVASHAWRNASAATRHTVWVLTLVCVLLIPVATLTLPPWRVAVPAAALPVPVTETLARRASLVGAAMAPPQGRFSTPPLMDAAGRVTGAGIRPSPAGAGTATVRGGADIPPSPASAGTASSRAGTAWQTWIPRLWAVWALGVVLCAVRLAWGAVQVERLRRRALAVSDPAWLSLRDEIARRMGVARHVLLLRDDRYVMPMTWGLREPVILLPADADEWSAAQRATVLTHELAHVRRRDALTQWLGHLAVAVYWFNPLVWLAAHRLREERERACDDVVLRLGSAPTEYAGHLLRIVRSRAAAPDAALAMGMARPSAFEGRLRAVLDRRVSRDGTANRTRVLTTIVALCALLPVAAVTPGMEVQGSTALQPPGSEDPDHGEGWPSQVGDDGHALMSSAEGDPLAASATAAPATVHPQVPDTVGRPVTASLVVRRSAKGGAAGIHETEATVEARDVFLAPDRSRVAGIRSGGMLLVEEQRLAGGADESGAVTRRVHITPQADGGLHHEYHVDGVSRPFDDAGREWLATFVTHLRTHHGRPTAPAPVHPRTPSAPRPPPPAAAHPAQPPAAGNAFTRSLTRSTVKRTISVAPSTEVPVTINITAHDVVLTADRSGVDHILPGGLLRVEMEPATAADTPHLPSRRLLITPLAGDRLQYDYSVDGISRPFDDEARAWLAAIIQTDMR
jgi:beta-lactamase regulating signal transducer with metallopeptidase domain